MKKIRFFEIVDKPYMIKMKKFKEFERGEEIHFYINFRGHHHGQYDSTIIAHDKDKEYLGHLDYSEYQDKAYIGIIKVEPNFKKMGIGKALVRRLAQEVPYNKIEWGYTTEEGNKLKQTMDKEFGVYK